MTVLDFGQPRLQHAASGTLIRPLLVDRGLSLSEIGWLLGVVSYAARIVAALIAGVVVIKDGVDPILRLAHLSTPCSLTVAKHH